MRVAAYHLTWEYGLSDQYLLPTEIVLNLGC